MCVCFKNSAVSRTGRVFDMRATPKLRVLFYVKEMSWAGRGCCIHMAPSWVDLLWDNGAPTMRYLTSPVALIGGLAVAGCSMAEFETDPVEVVIPAVTVTCQLYSRDIVMLDRAIDSPPGMTIAQADVVCRAYGQRLLEAV